jgi:hypothetical protein
LSSSDRLTHYAADARPGKAAIDEHTPDPKPFGYPEEIKREAVRLYLEGTNVRRIGRILSVNHQSVVN